ncbi:hypothetical protein NY2A_b600L [Paramecium bursaria Chlorella virus NY2A]|uniref:Uncharacterized protein b600L n=1 Tax=Paramecium bursaria Chlorella virus NY2A TaxID=46021 RepID=A7IXC5_PBCVN|nr:hypothetical protein NY2A_b600L [Paramecium bursaria Chlorella virus NY2A]ABT14999.1 hypothetical protein NY2A_b600L [Paramecium bursaria Chlorella virus NY2A]
MSSCFSYGIPICGQTKNQTIWCFIKKIIVSTSVLRISISVRDRKTERMLTITVSMTVRRSHDNRASHTKTIKSSKNSKV